MSRYFIAHIIDGDAAKFCRQISAELAQEFSVPDAHKNVPPHLTLKAPFTADDAQIADLQVLLQQASAAGTAAPIELCGYDHFNKGVIYLKVSVPPVVRRFSQFLTERLHTLPWMPFSQHDEDITFHATLVRPQSPEQFAAMWQYLQSHYLNRRFENNFNTVSLLAKQNQTNVWTEAVSYQLTA